MKRTAMLGAALAIIAGVIGIIQFSSEGTSSSYNDVITVTDILKDDSIKLRCDPIAEEIKSKVGKPDYPRETVEVPFIISVSDPTWMTFYHGPSLVMGRSLDKNSRKYVREYLNKIEKIVSGEKEFFINRDRHRVDFGDDAIKHRLEHPNFKKYIGLDRTTLRLRRTGHYKLFASDNWKIIYLTTSQCKKATNDEVEKILENDLKRVWFFWAKRFVYKWKGVLERYDLEESKKQI